MMQIQRAVVYQCILAKIAAAEPFYSKVAELSLQMLRVNKEGIRFSCPTRLVSLPGASGGLPGLWGLNKMGVGSELAKHFLTVIIILLKTTNLAQTDTIT